MARVAETAEASARGILRLLQALTESIITSALGAVYLDSVFSYSTSMLTSSRNQKN